MILRSVLSVLLALAPIGARAEYYNTPNYYDGVQPDQCPQFFPRPVANLGRERLITICRINYAVIYDTVCKIPVLTFESLIASEIDGVEPRTNVFRVDPGLLSGHASTLSDYRSTGYDRGHMVPAGDMMEDSVSMLQTFYLSNIVPQNAGMNRGIWRQLEFYARSVIEARGDEPTYIITGAVIDKKPTLIGNSVCVPSGMFKTIVSGERVESFLMGNRSGHTGDLQNYVTTIEPLFGLVGITY